MIRGVWTMVVFGVLTLLFGLPAAIAGLFRPGGDTCNRAARPWSRGLLAAAGARPHYHGLDNMTAALPCVFVSNHLSVVDIWVLLAVLPLSVRFAAKKSLFRWPVLGWALTTSGFVPIDRSDRANSIRSLREASQRIRQGTSILMFPEGTRSRDGRLMPFKKGPFHLALDAGVPVVPITIRGTDRVVPPGSLRAQPGDVQVIFDAPIPVGRFRPGDVDGLRDATRDTIAARLGEPTASRDVEGLAG